MSPEHNIPTSSVELSPEIQAEISAAMEQLDEEAKSAASHRAPAKVRGPRVVEAGRERRVGKVVSVGPTDIFLEFGPKQLGVIERQQFKEGDTLPEAGQELEVVIQKYERDENLYVCALPGAVQKAAWEMLQPGQGVEARVTGVVNNKEGKPAGLELEIDGHRAFMPAGQVSLDRIADLSVFIGEKMPCVVQRIDRRGSGNIVLSRRELLAAERKQQAEKIKSQLVEGAVLEGVVRKVMPFGCFVDLGGVDGLVHVSDLTHERAGHGEKFVEKFVKEGQRVRVQILKVDLEADRISLGMKQLQDDPFQQAAGDITEGADVTGRVVRIAEFGAFIELAPGVEGLAHISELEYRRVAKVEEVLQVDQVVTARVLKVDKDNRRISLSLKALKDAPQRQEDPRRKAKNEAQQRAIEEITKETPAFRRLREEAAKRGVPAGKPAAPDRSHAPAAKAAPAKSAPGKGLAGGIAGGRVDLGGGLGELRLG
ncbi:MAG: S1 RNA-binding domain-containing protein [Phycisphaerales bacterium]|jgi:small subunit ribosomal protein S1|nr:S1 RNA-binding domain-containing protein [Phycisphaerales bacterium]